MKIPKVSIITINFNDANGLEKTILSVRNQLFTNYEHIIIDGGSKDDSKFIIEKYKDGFSKWVSESDKGIYDAQNKGIKYAKGEYCLFLNSGDLLVDENVLNKVWTDNRISEDIIYGDMLIDNGKKIKYGVSPKDLDLYFLSYNVLWHCVSFIKRSLFKKFGLYDLDYKIAADVEFFLKAIGVGGASVYYIPMPISQFNTFGFGSNPNNLLLLEQERTRMRNSLLNKSQLQLLDKFHLINKNYQILSYFFLPQILNYLRSLSGLKSIVRKIFQFIYS
ncbi:MAG: glycosyltransferase [Leptospiraceae bacterium]|nr:glycosyltransferase [Leptospiraceae bacterium]